MLLELTFGGKSVTFKLLKKKIYHVLRKAISQTLIFFLKYSFREVNSTARPHVLFPKLVRRCMISGSHRAGHEELNLLAHNIV
jgi:hypothetical protein